LNNNKSKKTKQAIDSYTDKEGLQFDPNGSWTGLPSDKYEKPIQDADDL